MVKISWMDSMRSLSTRAKRLPWTVADPPREVFRNGTRPKGGQHDKAFLGRALLTAHGQQALPQAAAPTLALVVIQNPIIGRLIGAEQDGLSGRKLRERSDSMTRRRSCRSRSAMSANRR